MKRRRLMHYRSATWAQTRIRMFKQIATRHHNDGLHSLRMYQIFCRYVSTFSQTPFSRCQRLRWSTAWKHWNA